MGERLARLRGRAALTRRAAARRRRRRLGGRGLDRVESRLVWIFGSPRTGSTWLLQMLAEAGPPGVAPLNESWAGELLDRPTVWRQEGSESFTVNSSAEAHKYWPPWILNEQHGDVWRPWMRGLILSSFRAQLRRGPARTRWRRPLLVVKEPNSSDAADRLVELLPRSRVIFLVRDGRDTVDSILDGFANGLWGLHEELGWDRLRPEEREEFLRGASAHWLYRTEAVQRACELVGFGRHLVVRYEDLLADTPTELARVGEWLGLESAATWADEVAPRHAFELIPAEERGPGRFYRAATPGLWRRNMTAAEQALLEEIIGAKLRELGYATEPVGEPA